VSLSLNDESFSIHTVNQTFYGDYIIERHQLLTMAGTVTWLLFLSLSFTYVNGDDCQPCHCEEETIDCSGVDVIPTQLFYRMDSFQRIIMPSRLIDGKILQLGLIVEPTDTRECAFICTIVNVRSTCTCAVSFFKNYLSLFHFARFRQIKELKFGVP
jgi:hypothetical protein